MAMVLKKGGAQGASCERISSSPKDDTAADHTLVLQAWTRRVQQFGASAWVLMAPALHDPQAMQKALAHPCALRVELGWLCANARLDTQVIRLEDEVKRGVWWARDLRLHGYRSAVECRFGLVGAHSCRLWILSTGELLDESAAMMVWHAHCAWPSVRRVMFEQRSLLTARETRCLQEFAAGKTQTQAAEAMECSVRTVRFHLENAMEKLGADSSGSAVQKALLLGLA